jgi:hypothetical protein
MADRNSDIDNPERLEAEARVIMWEHSRIDPDGFDPSCPRRERQAERARLHREFDTVIDRWATSRLLRALANISGEKK